MQFVRYYLVALAIFFALDMLWLGVIAKNFYQEQIGFLLKEEINWIAGFLFYALYLGGLVYFAIWPAVKEGNAWLALANGALFGLMCYAAYDLTNLATLEGWPIKVTVYDMIWGTFLSGVTSWFSALVAMR